MAGIFRNFESGAGANALAQFKTYASAAGVNLPGNDPAQAQQAAKDNFNQSIAKLKEAGLQRITQLEVKMSGENFANPNLQPAANFAIIAQDLGKTQMLEAFTNDLHRAQLEASNSGGPLNVPAFENSWFNHNSLNTFVDMAKAQIGPFKGMTPEQVARELPKINSPQEFAQKGYQPGMWFVAPDMKAHQFTGGQ